MPDAEARFDPLVRIDPWTALRDGRMQLLAAIDRLAPEDLDRRIAIDGFDLRIAEAAALHVAWDRLHRTFFAGIVDGEVSTATEPEPAGLDALETVEAVAGDLDAARREMLEAAAGIAVERYEERIAAPWDGAVIESIRGYLVAMAMRDGMLAEAIVAARRAR
jgi:hypothetical protein